MSESVPATRADGEPRTRPLNRGRPSGEERLVAGLRLLPRTRRAPYPVSPTIGPDGMRACREILDAARLLFVERGYHATSIQAVAEAAGRSDTAVYQYFRGKQEIFRILFEELGAELVALFAAMPTLTADRAGLAAFQVWLEELGAVLRRHSPVFADWPLEDEPAVDNPSEEYLRQLGALIHGRLAFADTDDVDTRVLSIAVICVVEWAHIVLDAGAGAGGPERGAQEKALHDTLARIIHRAVFPAAHAPDRDAALATPDAPGARRPVACPGRPAADDQGAPEPGLRKAVTARGRSTVEKVLVAAVAAFEQRGLAGTSVNDIIARAGVAHGSFYQYWTDRTALFTTLTHRAAVRTCDHFDRLGDVSTGPELAGWLDEWLRIVEQHGTVFHVWTVEMVETPPLWPAARAVRACLDAITAQLARRWPAATPLEARTGTITLWTLLTELPYNGWLRHSVLTRDEILSCQRLFLGRGILGDSLRG
ncbi:TetR/AcrR family transcriptional regulator [Frankia tisae]|uniref:TetR/AcrR family transcriptional regulator n=1 Tax=Frankia tisae TaxID=2950104 RepID=UPI0021C1F63D|nr:TetR/AcrR family transcriptional regulator [Frankia tisae]